MWLKRKPKAVLGIDFGAGGIKLTQLRSVNGRESLHTYGFCERPPEEVGIDYLENPDAAGALLKLICAKAKTTTINAVAALPIPSVFSAVLSLAAVSRQELPQAVEWEAKKLIPLPLSEIVLDFKVLKAEEPPAVSRPGEAVGISAASEKGEKTAERNMAKAKEIAILLTAAPRSIIDKYLAIAKIAGITLASLETEAFAIIRAVVGADMTPAIVVDIGAVRSNIIFVDRGIPILTRSVEIGGKKCSEAIATALAVSLQQAETLKRDLGVHPLPGTSAGGLSPIMKDTLDPLINELRYSFTVYKSRGAVARPPERIILIGGGAGLPGLAEMLTAEFNLRAFLGNPWDRVNFQADLQPLLNSFGSRFAVAVGLALRNL